jgi:sigma-B regulation protein RsbQ
MIQGIMDPIKKNNITITGNLNASRTILFGHGFGTDQTAWEKVSAPFMENYKIVLYDLVGAGKSDINAFSPNRYDTLYAYADDLMDICETLNLSNAILIGHSVSGMISMLAGINAPQYFSKMVLVGASPCYINDEPYVGGFTQEALNDLYNSMETNYYAWISGFAPYVMSNENKPELAESFAKTLAAIRPDIAVSVARTIFQSDYRHKLSSVTIPTLLLHNENDAAVPVSVGVYMQKQMPNSTLELINAEGHFPHISAPEHVIDAIERFIA